MYTVKAFKPFELISEDFEDANLAENRFYQLVKEPEIDAAYIFQDGTLFHAWAENYDDENGGQYEPMSYIRHQSISYLDPRYQNLFRMFVWDVPEGKQAWEGHYQPVETKKFIPGSEVESFQICAHDENGKHARILITEIMSYDAARWIMGMVYDLYYLTRLVQAARHTVNTDALFAEETLEHVHEWLLDLIGRKSIPAKEDKQP